MRTYILIGGIGSGKSTAARLLAERGACVLDLDKVGHEVLGSPSVRARLVERFGQGILDEQGGICRSELASRAFATSEAAADLNAITHPAIVDRARQMLEQMRQDGCNVAVVEVSAYDGPGGAFDPLVEIAEGIIVVSAPTALRIDRAVDRGLSEQDARSRIERQATEGQRLSWGTIVIPNAGTLGELEERIDELWAGISRKV